MTSPLDDTIRYENEHTALDFKRAQYRREQHPSLVRDVIAMANASFEGDRLIICGVSAPHGGPRELFGVPHAEFVDAAVYQQLVAENVEPSLDISYEPYEIDGVIVGVLRVSGCAEQPYLLRKRLGDAERGLGWIRKGSTQLPLAREDFERMYGNRASRRGFAGPVSITFLDGGSSLTIAAVQPYTPPSERHAARIRKIMDHRRRPGTTVYQTVGNIGYPMQPTPYEQRPSETLQRNLERVKETYRDDDLYELHNRCARRVQLQIINGSEEYIEDARVELLVPSSPGLLVADKRYDRPERNPLFRMPYIGPRTYPRVERRPEGMLAWDEIEAIRHHVPTLAFREPLLVTPLAAMVGTTVSVTVTLRGRNLRQPISRTLSLAIAAPAPPEPQDDDDD